jgi:hypothetical protein
MVSEDSSRRNWGFQHKLRGAIRDVRSFGRAQGVLNRLRADPFWFIMRPMKREPGKLEVEPIRPLEADWWRTIPIIEPKRPFRWVRGSVLGVTVLFAVVAGGGYYGLRNLWQVPVASQVVPPLNAAAKPAGAEASAIHLAPQLAVGLRPLTSRQPGESTTTPASEQAPSSVPGEPPKYAFGLRPVTDRVQREVPQSAAEAATPAEPPPALPQPRPVRKAAPPPAAPGLPSTTPSSPIKF